MPRPVDNKQSGFTLIELMMVMAIVSILMVVAIPVYSDYATRTKVSEGLGFAAAAKTTVTESYYNRGLIPSNNNEAGLPPPEAFDFEHISRLEVSTVPVPGSITITYRIPTLGSDNLLQLVPTEENGEMLWRCTPPPANGVSSNRLPANCRG